MSTFKIEEDRTVVGDKSLLFGYNVVEFDDAGQYAQRINETRLGLQGARELAAVLTWMVHLDTWMTTVVEDEDVAEEVAAILGLDTDMDLPEHGANSEEITKAYDRMVVGALKFLPAGMRRLADRYEQEWRVRQV